MGAALSQSEPRPQNRPYRCFLLRCWVEEGAGPSSEPVWRFVIRQAEADAARLSFSSFHDVAAYIEAELASCAAAQKAGDSGRT
jgi:hypothetical protein